MIEYKQLREILHDYNTFVWEKIYDPELETWGPLLVSVDQFADEFARHYALDNLACKCVKFAVRGECEHVDVKREYLLDVGRES